MGFFTPFPRFSAIRCAAAVARPPPERPRAPAPAQGPQRHREPDTASTVNGHGPPAARAPPRGIMGMFAAKAAARAQDTAKEAKAEAKEAPGVSYLRPPASVALVIRSHSTPVTSGTPALLLGLSPRPTGGAQ